MMRYSNSLLLSMVLLLLSTMGACHNHNDNGCGGHRCGRHGPIIRFPFRLKDKEPDHCGYPGFELSCTDNDTVFELPAAPVPIKLLVTYIGYLSKSLSLSDPENCLPRQFLKLNHTSISPFRFQEYQYNFYNISFFNCSPDAHNQFSCPIRTADSSATLLSSNLVSCTKMFDMLTPRVTPGLNYMDLWWSKPDCTECEIDDKQCKLKNNGTEDEVECFVAHPKPIKKIILTATGVPVGSILLVLLVIAFFRIFHHYRMKGEDRARIERFLEDYRALKPTRFSYADIKRITNGFKDKLGEGSHGVVFKGMLSHEILVAVKMLNNTDGDGKDFTNEVGTMGKIHHVNVVRLLGFCADGFYRALVYDFFPNGSLQNFISPPDKKDIFLGWEKLQQIALGVAKGTEYLHYGCEHQILHFDINPHNVLLDDSFTPKITDFGLAKLCPKNQSTVSISAMRGTLGYMAPEVVSRNFGSVSYKSDIYSYGMLLLEIIGGRKNMDMPDERTVRVLYPEWMHTLLDGGDVHIQIEDEEAVKIAKKLAIVGLWCIQWHPAHRPSMKAVIQMLEGDGDKLTVPHNPFESTSSTSRGPIIQERHLSLELEVIQE